MNNENQSNNLKQSAEELAQKIKNNETVNKVTTKINGSKYSALIKIGVLALAVFLVISLFSTLFADKYAKLAEEAILDEYTEMLEDYGAENVKIKTKLIATNKDAGLYCFDTTASCKYEGEKREQNSFILVYSTEDDTFLMQQYEYDKENKGIKKEVALSALSRG